MQKIIGQDHDPLPFIDYWDAVDSAMLEVAGIDTNDIGIEPDLIADAQEAGVTPAEFLRWIGITQTVRTGGSV
ncbi:hypothetical protein [Hyphomicrobium sp.]|jgi:hypothetical protein|uniref:hypothetical protein n=1 Tax=Hyphomicrobium sp. TaxID=82 RepID=UPI00356914B5